MQLDSPQAEQLHVGGTPLPPLDEQAPNDPPPVDSPDGHVLPEHDVDDRLARIEAALADVAQRLDADTERAAARERVIDRQHADIERLRAAERTGLMRPVVTDLCRLRNDLLTQARTRPEQMTGGQVSDLLGSFADMVEQALERCGVEVLSRQMGGRITAGSQQIARALRTDDPALDGTVAEVLQDGYAELDGGRVVVPARVAVFRWSPTDRTTEGTPTKETTDG